MSNSNPLGPAYANLSTSELDHAIQMAVADFPALAPPEGITVNFDNPYSRGFLVTMTSAIVIPTVTIFVLVRMYTKALINKGGLGKEDYSCLLAWAGFLVFNSFSLWMLQCGYGVHQWNVHAVEGMHFAQRANYLAIAYEPTIFFAKLSLLLQILKLFAPNKVVNRSVYWICHSTIWFNLVLYTILLFLRIFQCTPIAKIWDLFLPGTCRSPITTLVIASSVNAVTDFLILILPLICVFKLQMSPRQKWGVSAIFATGIFACICSVLRTVTSVQLYHTEDLTYGLMFNGLWANGELSSAILASCMICLPQFIQQFWPKIARWVPGRWRKSSSAGGGAWSDRSADPVRPGLKIVPRKPDHNVVASFPSDTSTLPSEYMELEEGGGGGSTGSHVFVKGEGVKLSATEVYSPV